MLRRSVSLPCRFALFSLRSIPQSVVLQFFAFLLIVLTGHGKAMAQATASSEETQVHPNLIGSNGSSTGTASFLGNLTSVTEPSQTYFAMQRASDCSLGLMAFSVPNLPTANGNISVTVAGNTPHYEQTLHQLASLTTTTDKYPGGCTEKSTGLSSRTLVYVGKTQQGNGILAFTINGVSDVIATVVYSSNFSTISFDIQNTVTAATAIATADLNNDGYGDLVIVNGNNLGTAFISVMLGNSDGTFQNPVNYPIAGNMSVAAVIDDVNGDGKLDIIAASGDQQISVLTGKGDGTFNSAQSFSAPLPGSTSPISTPIVNLITADLRGSGKKDIVCSNGLVLFGNGDGTFTASPTVAFPFPNASNTRAPNLASGDINNDGKLDLVVNTGTIVSTWIGKGDGTFTQGSSYASMDNTGYVTVTDLDGDGNADIYSGIANNGFYTGYDFEPRNAYVLMGNGDGTFQGAPNIMGAYNGTNLGDINDDGTPDLISNTTGQYNQPLPTFTVQLGTGKGTFTSASTITAPANFTGTTSALTSPVTITNANTVGATSYTVADVNGDGKADLVFVDNGLTAINPGNNQPITYPAPIYFVALSNGDGTFATPVPYNFPQLAPASSYDGTVTASTVQIADFNHDGHPDLLFTYNEQGGGPGTVPYNQGFVIVTGKGDGTFSTTAIITPTYSSTSAPTNTFVPTVLSTVDLNGDGKPDLIVNAPGTVITNFQLQTATQIYIGNGDGTFKTPTTIPADDEYGIPVVVDFNKDGKLDLAFLAETSAAQAELIVALGNGDGTFATPTVFKLSGGDAIRSAGIAAADFDNDGNIDLALLDAEDFSGIYYGKGDGTFTSIPLNGNAVPKDLINLAASGITTAVDLNKDGKPDLLVGNTILLNIYGTASTLPALISTTTTLTASSATIATGASITFTATITPTVGPTGTVTFYDGATALGTGTIASGTATYTTTALATGSHNITAVYSGDTAFGTSTSSSVPITVNAVPVVATTTTLAASATNAVSGTSLTFTATVTPASGVTSPTGTVTFTDGSTSLGTGTLASGKATFTTSALSVGSHTITATYSGDTTYASSTSGSTIINITAAAPGDFSIAISPSSGTVNQGNTATSTVTITPAGGFSQQVSFACSGLPSNTSCSFSPATVTPNGTSGATSTLTIKTDVASAALYRPALPSQGSGGTTALAFLSGGGLLGLTLLRRRKSELWYVQLALALTILTASTVVGCGGSGSGPRSGSTTPTGTYQISVTGTAASTTHSATYSLSVQ